MNLKIREFKLSLEKYIKSADIPAEAKRIVLEGIYNDIAIEANSLVSAELDEREKKEEEGGSESE